VIQEEDVSLLQIPPVVSPRGEGAKIGFPSTGNDDTLSLDVCVGKGGRRRRP